MVPIVILENVMQVLLIERTGLPKQGLCGLCILSSFLQVRKDLSLSQSLFLSSLSLSHAFSRNLSLTQASLFHHTSLSLFSSTLIMVTVPSLPHFGRSSVVPPLPLPLTLLPLFLSPLCVPTVVHRGGPVRGECQVPGRASDRLQGLCRRPKGPRRLLLLRRYVHPTHSYACCVRYHTVLVTCRVNHAYFSNITPYLTGWMPRCVCPMNHAHVLPLFCLPTPFPP